MTSRKSSAQTSGSKKKAASKKAASKKAATKKTATRASKKSAAKKAPAAKKSAAKKAPAAKKSAAKKAPAAKKSAAKKAPAAKKSAAKKAPAAKKSAAKKAPAAKKSAAKKAPAAKATSTRKRASKAAGAKSAAATQTGLASSTVQLAPRSTTIAPSIPIPVKEVPKAPTLEERARATQSRILSQSGEFLEHYDENFEMSWIYHDTALEGVVYTFEELTTAFRSDEVTVVDSSVMPIYDAIRRHKAAIAYVRETAKRKRNPIHIDTLKTIYSLLHPEEGDPKSVRYRRDIPQHRLYFHEYGAPDRIAYRVRQALERLQKSEDGDSGSILKRVGRAHYELVRIYPFQYASGKVARMFMSLLMMRAGLPPAIIHAAERQRYYDGLKSASAAQIVQMLENALDNSISSIDKLLDRHERRSARK